MQWRNLCYTLIARIDGAQIYTSCVKCDLSWKTVLRIVFFI